MNSEILLKINGFLENTKYRCIDFIIKGERNVKILEIYVDSREIFDIDELAKLNRDLWDALQNEEILRNISKIIVSSPGIDRSFKYIWQIYKHIGKMLVIKLINGDILNGKILDIINDKEIILEVLKNKKEFETVKLNFDEIQESKVKIKY